MSYLEKAKRYLEKAKRGEAEPDTVEQPHAPGPDPGGVGQPSHAPSCYAGPWPDALPELGPRSVGPFTPCSDCGAGSWVRYGDTVLCLTDAQRRAS